MNQRGFATILGLCLILIVALIAGGINAAETNHAYKTTDFGAEFELQNAADSAIYAAADKVLVAKENGEELLPVNPDPNNNNNTRDKFQVKLITATTTSEQLGTITTEAYGEIINVQHYKVSYDGEDGTDASKGNVAKSRDTDKNAYVFFSVAQATDPRTGIKIYRRAFAYVAKDDTAIRFMEVPMSSYKWN